MATGARKAKRPEATAEDFARAEARAAEVERACKTRCEKCPGPGVPGGCETRPRPGMIAGRSDWPVCPSGLRRDPTWRRIVDLYRASLVAPLERWPRAYRPYVVERLVALREAVREEEQRTATKPGGDLPAFAATAAARAGGA